MFIVQLYSYIIYMKQGLSNGFQGMFFDFTN